MDPIEIVILLKRARVTQTLIAKKLGVTVPFVNHVIVGRRHTERVREAISKAIGKPVSKLWPNGKKKAGRICNHNKMGAPAPGGAE